MNDEKPIGHGTRCGCPVFMNYRLHRYPCGLCGHIDDMTPEPVSSAAAEGDNQ